MSFGRISHIEQGPRTALNQRIAASRGNIPTQSSILWNDAKLTHASVRNVPLIIKGCAQRCSGLLERRQWCSPLAMGREHSEPSVHALWYGYSYSVTKLLNRGLFEALQMVAGFIVDYQSLSLIGLPRPVCQYAWSTYRMIQLPWYLYVCKWGQKKEISRRYDDGSFWYIKLILTLYYIWRGRSCYCDMAFLPRPKW